MTHILLGTGGRTCDLAGFLACGLACLIAAIALLVLRARTGEASLRWRIAVTLLLFTGFALCGIGVLKWLGMYPDVEGDVRLLLPVLSTS